MSLAVENISDFDAIYKEYHQAVYANIRKMVGQVESAEDILQEVFLTLWKNRLKVNKEKVGGWLFVVSYNKAASFLKSQLRLSFIQLEDIAMADKAAEEDLSQEVYQLQLSLIEKAIQYLPERKKEVFRLHFFEGRSHEEIATLLGISIPSVKDYIKQSMGIIRQHTSRHYDGSLTAMTSLLLVFSCLS